MDEPRDVWTALSAVAISAGGVEAILAPGRPSSGSGIFPRGSRRRAPP